MGFLFVQTIILEFISCALSSNDICLTNDLFLLQPTRHSKLEKADILEMTVKHLQSVQRQQLSTAVATDPAVLTKFRSGFSECATEVSRYVSHLENVDPTVKQRLVSHLNNCVTNLQQVAPFYNHYVPYMPDRLFPEVKMGFQSEFPNGDENNNGSARIQIPSGVQLIPSRLPSGELALLVPPSTGIASNFPFYPPAPEASRIGQASAFTAVQRSHSPLLSPSTSTSSFEENHHSEQYPHSQSPNDRHRFKIPDQSPASSKSFSSPETQRPQISSSSDRKSPIPTTLTEATSTSKRDIHSDSTEHMNAVSQCLRQPLSVITDKTYNRSPTVTKREGLKRHNSEGLLTIYGKRPKYHEASSSIPSTSSTSNLRMREEHTVSAEDITGRSGSSFERGSGTSNAKVTTNGEASAAANGDMWRPW